jgi:hypothetical protein
MSNVFKPTPIPDIREFLHNHECSKCKKFSRVGILTYSNKIETTKFICEKCQPVRLIPAQLPMKSDFRLGHKCFECEKIGSKGMVTYCEKCEEGEFVCNGCIPKLFEKIINELRYGNE